MSPWASPAASPVHHGHVHEEPSVARQHESALQHLQIQCRYVQMPSAQHRRCWRKRTSRMIWTRRWLSAGVPEAALRWFAA